MNNIIIRSEHLAIWMIALLCVRPQSLRSFLFELKCRRCVYIGVFRLWYDICVINVEVIDVDVCSLKIEYFANAKSKIIGQEGELYAKDCSR